MPRRPTWRHAEGKKGVNRVCVYERRDREALYVEYWDAAGERIQRTIETFTGLPVLNTPEGRRIAVKVAERYAQEREKEINREMGEVYGLVLPRTVAKLLSRLHADRSADWSVGYNRDQNRYRVFWETKIGSMTIPTVNAALVNRIASERAKAEKWSPRTQGAYLRYIIDAFYYAERKLKWIGPRDNLSAVDMPSAQSKSRGYTLDQVKKLLPALEEVDRRAGAIGHIAWQTGRRLSAIRHLKKKDVLSGDGRAVLQFRSATDKTRKEGESVVVGRAAEIVAELMGKPGKYLLGTSVPGIDICEDWMLAAEKVARIKHEKYRAWHGLKRRWATESQGMRGREKQGGTTMDTLNRIYVQDDEEPKADVAQRLSDALQ